MDNPQKEMPKTPPFVERKTSPPRKESVDTRGMLSIVTMLVSLAAVTISLAGAGRLAFDVLFLDVKPEVDDVFVKLLVLVFAMFFGWGAALASIRGFGNLLYPIVINIYAWVCMLAVCGLYFKVMQKMFEQEYGPFEAFIYLLILLGGLVVLLALHLLVEGHDLRPFAIPLLTVSVVHLFVIVIRYVFADGAETFDVFYDFLIFTVMIVLAALMLLHIGIFSSLRAQIDGVFANNGSGKQSEE